MNSKYYVERTGQYVWTVATESGSNAQEFSDEAGAIQHCGRMNRPQVQVAKKSRHCATCTANICSVIDDCHVAQAKESTQTLEAEISSLRTQAGADAAEIERLQAEVERLDKRNEELSLDLVYWRNRGDKAIVEKQKAQAKLSKIRKVINEN